MSDNEFVTEEQYLVEEPQREYKSEYRDGRVVAMSGASTAHNRITGNLYYALRVQLEGKPCEAFIDQLKIKVAQARFYTYPDLSVVCGEPEFDPKDVGALLNPTIVFEVLSPSTEAYDRGEKFGYYQKLTSLREYVLVSQSVVKVEHFALDERGAWGRSALESLDLSLELPAAGVSLAVRDIYQRVTF